MTQPAFNRKLVFSAACLGMLIFGIVMAVLGAVLPSLVERYGLTGADSGALFTTMVFGMLGGSLIFGPLVDRFGYKWILAVCTLIVMGGFIGLAMAPTAALLTPALIFIGFGGGIINGGTNALVSDVSHANRGAGLSILGVFFGIGAFGIPFVLGALLDLFTYSQIVATVGILLIVPFLFFALLTFPAPKQAQGFPVGEALELTRDKTLLLFGVILFLQSGLEMTIGGWSSTYLIQEMEVSGRNATIFLSLYWLGMMLARIGLARLLLTFRPAQLLNVGLAVALIGIIVFLSGVTTYVAVAGMMLLGAGFAVVFPIVLALVGDAYSKLSGTAFSVVLAIGLMGGMTLPWLTGVLADVIGLREALMLVPISLASIFVLFRIGHKRVKRGEVTELEQAAEADHTNPPKDE